MIRRILDRVCRHGVEWRHAPVIKNENANDIAKTYPLRELLILRT